MEIYNLKRQSLNSWIFYTFQNRPVYVYYIDYILKIYLGKPYCNPYDIVDKDLLFKKKMKTISSSRISWKRVEKILKKLPSNTIDLVFFKGEIQK